MTYDLEKSVGEHTLLLFAATRDARVERIMIGSALATPFKERHVLRQPARIRGLTSNVSS